MNDKYHHIAIALAGVCQSALLIPQLANSGQADSRLYHISLISIFNTSPSTTESVFGGLNNVQIGLQCLKQLLSNNQQSKVEVMRYVFGSIGLATRLIKKTDGLEQIGQRLEHIKSLYTNHFDEAIDEHHDQISYSLAGIYSDIISPLASKIQVRGKVEYLQNSLVQAKVRTALFGCIRSAILWYQVGGNRWHFLFAKKKILKAIDEILLK